MAAPVPPQSTYIASEGVETVITTAADGFSRGNALTTSFSGSQDALRSYSAGTVDSAALSALKAGLPAGKQLTSSFPNAETREGPTVIAVKVEPSPILVVDQDFGREAAASTTQAPQSTQAPPSSGVGGGDSYAGFGGAGAGGAGAGAGLGGLGAGGLGVGVGYGAGAAVAGAIILKKLLVLKGLLVKAVLVG
jgi:hypothetical protein